MMSRLVLLAIIALSAACARAGAPPVNAPPPAPVSASVADPMDDCPESASYRECLDRVEAAGIAGQGGRVTRDGLTLRFARAGGRSDVLTDDTVEGDSYVRFSYTAFIPALRSHLVSVGYYEGRTYLLLHEETGGRTYLNGIPLISPVGTRFVTTSLDLEANYDPNSLQVWQIAEHAPRLILELGGGEEWGPSDARWVGENVIEFTRHTQVPNTIEHQVQRMRLVLDGAEVQVRALSP